ncbi:MAG: ASCH domain-containing protein [Pseudomonadota bacterium]
MQHLFEKTPRTDAFWHAYAHAHGVTGDYDVIAFGDSPAMATELADLVVAGVKRATAGLMRDFETGAEAPPKIGGHVVIVDGEGAPRAIWRTMELRVGPLISVTESFAWDEGEGLRTREDWLDGHRSFFARQAEREGFAMDDDIETVFERFRIVWPPEIAD